MIREQVLSNARIAGGVLRYHAYPTLQRQTVADHSFHVMRIYWTIFKRIPEIVAEFILWHDMGELVTGDMPFPFKAKHPAIKALLAPLEAEAVTAMGGEAIPLDKWLHRRIKACDLLEMLEFGLHEKALGNAYSLPIIHDTAREIGCLELNSADYEKVINYREALMEAYDYDQPNGRNRS